MPYPAVVHSVRDMKQRIDRIAPFALVAVFTVVVEGLSLMEFLPLPIALLIGAGWALGSRWREATELVESLDVWVYVGVVAAIAAAYGAHRVRRARSDP